jgi:hypothetical protein
MEVPHSRKNPRRGRQDQEVSLQAGPLRASDDGQNLRRSAAGDTEDQPGEQGRRPFHGGAVHLGKITELIRQYAGVERQFYGGLRSEEVSTVNAS